MNSEKIKQKLDLIIDQSQAVLQAIEEKEWGHFPEIESDRQKMIEEIKVLALPSENKIIECIKKISALNEDILSKTTQYQEELKTMLKNTNNKRSLARAYQQ